MGTHPKHQHRASKSPTTNIKSHQPPNPPKTPTPCIKITNDQYKIPPTAQPTQNTNTVHQNHQRPIQNPTTHPTHPKHQHRASKSPTTNTKSHHPPNPPKTPTPCIKITNDQYRIPPTTQPT